MFSTMSLESFQIHIAVEADRAARAFVLDQPALIHRQNLRMLPGQPDGRRGCRRGQNDFNPRFAQQVHHALEPGEVVFAFLRLAEPPGKLSHADDVNAGGLHQFHVMFPCGFGFLAGSAVWENPLFGMIIDTEIHSVLSRCGLFLSRDNAAAVQWKNGRVRPFILRFFPAVLSWSEKESGSCSLPA